MGFFKLIAQSLIIIRGRQRWLLSFSVVVLYKLNAFVKQIQGDLSQYNGGCISFFCKVLFVLLFFLSGYFPHHQICFLSVIGQVTGRKEEAINISRTVLLALSTLLGWKWNELYQAFQLKAVLFSCLRNMYWVVPIFTCSVHHHSRDT